MRGTTGRLLRRGPWDQRWVALLAVAVLLLTACGGGNDALDDEPTAAADGESVIEDDRSNDTESGQSPGTADLKVAFVATQEFGDRGPMDDMRAALEQARDEFGIELQIVESGDPAQYESDLEALAAAGTDLIVTAFGPITEPLHAVAARHPDVRFSHIFGEAPDPPLDNVRSILYEFYKGTYLAGVVAGMLTDSGQLGFVAGANIPVMNIDYNAFLAGARSVNPDVEGKIAYADGFNDPVGGKSLAAAMYAEGIDVIATDAAGTTLGVIEAAQEAGRFVIGDSADHSELAPENYVTSTLLNFGRSAYLQVQDLIQDTWVAESSLSGLDDETVALAPMDSFAGHGLDDKGSLVPDIEAALAEANDAIIAGEIEVPQDDQV